MCSLCTCIDASVRVLSRKLIVVVAIMASSMSSAVALEIEKLVMPGQLIEGHADIEAECVACHVPFSREQQDSRCIDCHQTVGADINVKRGFHGKNPDVTNGSCAGCHTDHIGRDADIVLFDDKNFQHKFADFLLRGAHIDVACIDCHEDDALFREAPSTCIACHSDDDVHKGGLGEDCASCHVEDDWVTVRFDHLAESGFALLGAHNETGCIDCHANLVFENTPSTCIGCHRDEDVHKGLLGDDCASCHNEVSWTANRFDHDTLTDFPLLGSHAPLDCEACHVDSVITSTPGTACIDCHRDDDPHDLQLGEDCGACHNEREWLDDVLFDHDFTAFPLLGEHRDASCDGCHETARFKDASIECIDCHGDEDVHDGVFGVACGTCHNPRSWDIWRFDHYVSTGFLLDGAHAELVCEDCHSEPLPIGASTPSRCIDCHRSDDIHNGEFGRDCGRCHITATFRGAEDMR